MSPRATRMWLAFGAAAGLALAGAQLLRLETSDVPPGAVAVVDGVSISRDAWERAVAGLQTDRRNPVGEAERRRALDRLVEEELLVQRGLGLGLARRDRRVRSDLVHAMIDSVLAESDGHTPSATAVRAFYDANADYFALPGRLRVRQVVVRFDGRGEDPEAMARARAAASRLHAGEAMAAVVRELGDPVLPPLPDTLMSPAKLRDYLGPTPLRAALALETGGVSEPVRSSAGWHVLQLVEREKRHTPPFEEIEDEVRAEMRRRAGDRALREYLDELRRQTDIRILEPLE